jgi:cell division protein ZapA
MSTIKVIVRNNVYNVACESGQEAHLQLLASTLNKRINKFISAFPQANDTMLLIMAALTTEDELVDLKKRHQQLSLNIGGEADKTTNSSNDLVLADTLDAITEYIDNLTEKVLKTS